MNKKDIKVVLWDFSEEAIGGLSADFVISRVLSYGGILLIVKAMREYGDDMVRQVFAAMKPTSISKKKYHYLKNFLFA
ncbi:MAG: hypothetical protein NUV61_00085 [Candidatus Azambacteria bacterium]|nr:hypothetical protein [Candidatus Azambacteria bacterium]